MTQHHPPPCPTLPPQEALAQAFPAFPHVFSSDQIHEHFVPLAFRLLTTAAVAVRPAAAEGLVQLLRYGRKERQRADIFLRIIRELARGRSFGQRVAFGHVAEHLLSSFSSKFVKEWLFELCLELLYDPVPNVRLQVRRLQACRLGAVSDETLCLGP